MSRTDRFWTLGAVMARRGQDHETLEELAAARSRARRLSSIGRAGAEPETNTPGVGACFSVEHNEGRAA